MSTTATTTARIDEIIAADETGLAETVPAVFRLANMRKAHPALDQRLTTLQLRLVNAVTDYDAAVARLDELDAADRELDSSLGRDPRTERNEALGSRLRAQSRIGELREQWFDALLDLVRGEEPEATDGKES